jgi:hypothetical protein
MASGSKRKTPVVARAAGKPAAKVPSGGAKKAAPRAKAPARKPAPPKKRDKVAEYGSMMHEHLAVGASAMGKAIRDAHKPLRSAKPKSR